MRILKTNTEGSLTPKKLDMNKIINARLYRACCGSILVNKKKPYKRIGLQGFSGLNTVILLVIRSLMAHNAFT
jgi:hypothetical protein